MYSNEILTPFTLEEALEIKNQYGKRAFPLAGGTDIFVMVRNNLGIWGESPPLLNLSQIVNLDFISENRENIEIGPLVTHSQILGSPIIERNVPALIKAVSAIGSPQIRNLGTLVGNICRASPAADTLAILYSRNAQIQIQTINDTKILPITEFITGPGQINIPDNGIVTKILIPKLEGYRGDYISLRQRYALSIVVVSIATEIILSHDATKVEDIRISLGAVAPTIVRAIKTEAYLKSHEFNNNTIIEAERMVMEECKPITDIRSNKQYRKAMTGVLLGRILRQLKK